MKVDTLIKSLETFPQDLEVVLEGRVGQDGTAQIADIVVAIHEGEEQVHLVAERANAPFEERAHD